MTVAHRCEQLAQGCYIALPRVGFEPATYLLHVQRYTRCTTVPPPVVVVLVINLKVTIWTTVDEVMDFEENVV